MTTEIDAVERLSIPDYRRDAMDDLRTQLLTVAKTPFYHRKFADADVDPLDVETPADLRSLPFTRKDELRASQERAPPFGEHRACAPDEIARVYSTSGTTGTPTFVGLTESDVAVWAQAGARAARAAGLDSSDVVVGILAGGPFAGAVTYDGHRAAGAAIAPVGPGNTDRVITLFQNDCGTVLLATPSYADYLLEEVRERDIDPADLGIERMLVGGEPGASNVRDRIESAFDCVLTESMGNSDMAISIWGECDHQNGMHFTGQGAVFPELIDPESGESLSWEEGTRGELVYTSLNRDCVPLVRFRSRDHVEVVTADCPCGRATACIRVLGRTDDMLIVRGVNVFPSAVEGVVEDIEGTTGHLRIHLPEGEAHVDAPVPITVERAGDADVDAETLADRVETVLRERLTFGAAVEVVPEGELERSQYKAELIERT